MTDQMMAIHSAVQMVEKKVGLTAQMMAIHSALKREKRSLGTDDGCISKRMG